MKWPIVIDCPDGLTGYWMGVTIGMIFGFASGYVCGLI